MKLTAELSLYPLQDEYLPIIEDFIAALHEHGSLDIVTNAMSTQVCGDFDHLFTVIRRELQASYDRYGRQVLVVKFIPGELPLRQ